MPTSPPNIAVVVVPYRPLSYYEELGPCVRDWAMITEMGPICRSAGVDQIIIDRPIFRPWTKSIKSSGPIAPSNKKADGVTVWQAQKVPLLKVLIGGRRASTALIAPILQKISNSYEKLLILDFDPFAHIEVPGNAIHWFDEIDDFTRHRRIPRRDRNAFAEKRAGSFCLHTASSLESVIADPLPNWTFTCGKVSVQEKAPSFDFGYIGYVDSKMDLQLVASLSERGTIGIWGKILDSAVGRKLKNMRNVQVHGPYHPSNIPHIMELFRIGIIPFRIEMTHGNSPIKYYQYSSAKKFCISTESFGLQRENLIIFDSYNIDNVIFSINNNPKVNWDDIDRQNNIGRDIFNKKISFIINKMIYE